MILLRSRPPMFRPVHAPMLAASLLATTLAGCVSSQRFAAPAQQPQAVPQGVPPQAQLPARGNLGGPYTRDREDREFGQPLNGSE
jgi:hypothetical protein